MDDAYAVRFVDQQTAQAWRDLRVRLADRLAAALEDGEMAPVEITAPTGQTLTVEVADEHEVITAGDTLSAYANVDEAAYVVYRVLRERWSVQHPAFLTTPLLAGSHPIEPAGAAVARANLPACATAESPEQLQEWVVQAFSAQMSEPLKVAPDGQIHWNTATGNTVTVRVRNSTRIELYARLADDVSIRRAHRLIDQLSVDVFGLRFFLVHDSLVASQIVLADPFVPEQLTRALSAFISSIDHLDWVEEKVQNTQTRADRAEIERLRQERDQARCEAESVRQALEDERRRLAEAGDEADALQHRLDILEEEYLAAQRESARIRRYLRRVVERQNGQSDDAGQVA